MKLVLNFSGNYNNYRGYIDVENFAQAKKVWTDLREEEECGSRDCGKKHGDILDDNNNKIAMVSYNGRVWDNEHNEIEIK